MTQDKADHGLLDLGGRVAIVTGAGGGIGKAVAKLFVEHSARVFAIDLPGIESPRGCEPVPCDLSDRNAIRQMVDHVGRLAGGVDFVVHCAGITRDRVLWKMTDEDWDRVLDVNLDSAFVLLRAVAPGMKQRRGGSIVLISSINGERGKFGQCNYAASKAGLIALGKSAARELGRSGIRVNSIAPGLVMTALTENLPAEAISKAISDTALEKAAEPRDIANAALFLCSSLSTHVTGQVLRVDGGQLTA